jgi:membrane protein implicated in regulation of membrane protease activity
VFNLYVASLIASLGAFAIQFFGGHHGSDGSHGGSHGDGEHGHASAWSLAVSVRFWSFALLAFGFVGTSLTLLGLAGAGLTAVVATGAGLGSGFFAAGVLRRLSANPASSHAGTGDVVGRVGRVIVPLVPGGRGKVRVGIKGASIDFVARSTETLASGEAVLIEESEGGEVRVSRAPKELS